MKIIPRLFYEAEKQTQDNGLNNPTDNTDTYCAKGTRIIQGLSDGDDHRHEHPYPGD
jgi:hypothetical protein